MKKGNKNDKISGQGLKSMEVSVIIGDKMKGIRRYAYEKEATVPGYGAGSAAEHPHARLCCVFHEDQRQRYCRDQGI
jgi:hypothetical protein